MTADEPSGLRIAAVQAASVAGDVEINVSTALTWIEAAAGVGARVVVLPELFLCGYDPATWQARPDDCDVTVEDPRLEPLRRTAQERGVAVIVGASVRSDDGSRRIAALSMSPVGRLALAYAKQHLWDTERSVFTPGDHGATVVVDGWDLGIGICYDGCFPEHARAAADAGALAYLCPSAYVVGSEHRRDLYYAARALDNGVYVVMAGLVGRCGELEFGGGSAIYDPQGRVVAAVTAGAGLAVATLDLGQIALAREINPHHRDRVADLGGRRVLALDGAASKRAPGRGGPDLRG